MTTLFNYDPYFDDFDEDKNFMRVLFRPGYALQARELTQLQTILSNQIERFGNNIFKNGSPIVGGKISLDDRAYYIVLNSTYNNEDVIVQDWLNKTIVGYNTTKIVRAKVIAVDDTTDNKVLVVKYLSGEKFAEDDEMKIFGQNTFAQAAPSSAVGRSYMASIQDGVYYFKGQFLKVVPQYLVLELYYKKGYDTETVNKQPSYKVGIEFEEGIIDEIDDTTLLDPAQGSFNYQAPGATRFRVQTTLSKRTLDSADESSFFEVLRIVDGVKTKEIDYPIFNEIEKLIARRTFDESGNYTVDPFVLSLEEEYANTSNNNYVDPDYFQAVLDPGKAYVGGYEVTTIAPTKIGVSRARTTSNVSDYNIPTYYGNYVIVSNMKSSGIVDIGTYPQYDIHCVPASSVSVADSTAYGSTKIGTMRVNNLKYFDSTAMNNGTTHTHRLGFFDLQASSIGGTLPSSGHTSTVITLPGGFNTSIPANTYTGMYFKITNGLGASTGPIKIKESDSGTITLSDALSFTPASNTFTIDGEFKTAESIIKKTGFAKTFYANISSESKDVDGNAIIIDNNKQDLIYEIPFDALKENSITNFDFYANKVYTNKISNAGGIITLQTSGTDTFAFAGAGGTLGSTAILDNIICVVREDSAENLPTGIVVNTTLSLTNAAFTVTAVSSTQLQIDLDKAGVRADFIVRTKVNNAEDGTNGAIRSKIMHPVDATLSHSAVPYNLDAVGTTLDVSNTGTITAFTGGYVYPDIGMTFFNLDNGDGTGTVGQLKTPGVPVSLQVPDVYEIIKIIDSKSNTSNVTTAMLSDTSRDITDNYELDNGQRSSHYDHSTIKLKRGYSSPTGSSILVLYRYYKHYDAPSPQLSGLFTVDSYSSNDYNEIPKFGNKKTGKIISARAALDFRPSREIAGSTYSGAINPDPDSVSQLSFEHYLSRIDSIVVKPSKEIVVVNGKPGVKPVAPTLKPEDMLIYTMYVPPYTESVQEIRADFFNNKRFTMKDIGNFENRIKDLEYYVSLNALEKNANDSKILDAAGLERSKYGILVDNFTSTDSQATYSDVGFDNRCMIEDGVLKPASLMRTFKLDVDPQTITNGQALGVGEKKSMVISYSTSKMAEQPYATKSQTVAGAVFGNFNGKVSLYPEFTSEVDTEHTAQTVMNSTQGLEDAFTFINDSFKYIAKQNPTWTNDVNNPFSKIVDSKWFETISSVTNQRVYLGGRTYGNLQTTTDRVYIQQGAELNQKQIGSSTSQVDVGSFVTDLSIQPYIKPRQITFLGNSLRPRTRYYTYFDDTSVDNYVIKSNKITTTTNHEFISGEYAILANNSTEASTHYTNYLNGIKPYNLVRLGHVGNTTGVNIVNTTGFALAGKYLKTLDSNKTKLISGSVTEHNSGVTLGVTSNTITLELEAPSVNISGNTLYLVADVSNEQGHGAAYNIIDYNTSTKVATIEGTTTTLEQSKNWIYSIGTNKTDEFGQIDGAFYPPVATFRTGERVLRLTESFNNTYDKDSISFGQATFVSSGVYIQKTDLVNTVRNIDVGVRNIGYATSPILQQTSINSRITSTWQEDPLAQTFYVDPQVYPNGAFVDNLDLFFKSKDDELSISVEIRPTVNGTPSSDYWYPESVVIKKSAEVNISDNPSVDDDTTKTNFKFSSPVYLKPGLYSIVVKTNSPDYILWTAEKGGTTTKGQVVSVNPYVGTLYKSQNSMEYVPYINEDLMFRINRCVFSTTPATFYFKNSTQNQKYYFDNFRLLETSLNSTGGATKIDYSFISTKVGGVKESSYREIIPNVKYSLADDTNYAIGFRRKQLQDKGDFTVKAVLRTTDTAVSPLIGLESINLNAWENFIDNAEINVEDFNIIAKGSGYSNSNTVVVVSTSGEGASITFNCDGVKGNVLSMNVQSSGFGYTDDFYITYPDTGNTANVTANAVVVLNSEFDSTGGPCLAKYITKPITLADGFDAGDLRVFLAANKPVGTEVHVYYKLLSSSDPTEFKDRKYQKMECYNPNPAVSVTNTDFYELEFRPSLTQDVISYTSDTGVTFDTFKTFSVKIVMTSSDPSVVPMIKDLRIIALPGG